MSNQHDYFHIKSEIDAEEPLMTMLRVSEHTLKVQQEVNITIKSEVLDGESELDLKENRITAVTRKICVGSTTLKKTFQCLECPSVISGINNFTRHLQDHGYEYENEKVGLRQMVTARNRARGASVRRAASILSQGLQLTLGRRGAGREKAKANLSPFLNFSLVGNVVSNSVSNVDSVATNFSPVVDLTDDNSNPAMNLDPVRITDNSASIKRVKPSPTLNPKSRVRLRKILPHTAKCLNAGFDFNLDSKTNLCEAVNVPNSPTNPNLSTNPVPDPVSHLNPVLDFNPNPPGLNLDFGQHLIYNPASNTLEPYLYPVMQPVAASDLGLTLNPNPTLNLNPTVNLSPTPNVINLTPNTNLASSANLTSQTANFNPSSNFVINPTAHFSSASISSPVLNLNIILNGAQANPTPDSDLALNTIPLARSNGAIPNLNPGLNINISNPSALNLNIIHNGANSGLTPNPGLSLGSAPSQNPAPNYCLNFSPDSATNPVISQNGPYFVVVDPQMAVPVWNGSL